MNVFKRDGRKVDFSGDKIRIAVLSAFSSVGQLTNEDYDVNKDTAATDIASSIATYIESLNKDLAVEEIQDIVERKLMESQRKDVAKAYIIYRNDRSRFREKYSDFMKEIGVKINATDVQNQNANVDEQSFGGRAGEANDVLLKKYALEHCMSEKSRRNHVENRVYIHDLGHYALGDHNCLSLPFDDLLKNGFKTRQTDVRGAKSINSACQLVAVLFQLQSLQQFGGVAATHLDWTLVPYIRFSFYKHYKDGIKYTTKRKDSKFVKFLKKFLPNFFFKKVEQIKFDVASSKIRETSIDDHDFYSVESAYEYAMDMTERETHQAMEGLYHNLNTLQSRSGNQLPFTSINYGTCTSTEGRMVTRNILEAALEGTGRLHRTSIFPCGIFQYMKGVNNKPDTPNYDLKKLAIKCTCRRLYPNYVNVDWSTNKGYDRNDPKTYVSTMGALAGYEHLYVKLENGMVFDISIKGLFKYCKTGVLPKDARPSQIYYTKDRFLKKGNRHKQQKTNVATGAGVYSITYIPEDVTYFGSSENVNEELAKHRSMITRTGGFNADISFNDDDLNNYKFEVLEYTADYVDAEKRYIETIPNINLKGTSKKYYKGKYRKSYFAKRPDFSQDGSVSQELIQLKDRDIKVLDKDGKWTKINHIFKNDKKNSPFMMHIRYKEFDKEYCLSCTEDHPLWTGKSFTRADQISVGDTIYRADGLELPVVSVSWHWKPTDSYDIGTATGTFIGSDIIMHNCRTYNGFDINGLGQLKDGRGNICPVTVILPTIAMETKEAYPELSGDELFNKFIEALDIAIADAKDMLIERFNWIASQNPESAKFMYENNLMAGYDPKEGIISALRHGTLALGQLGLAETLELLVGCNHVDPLGMEYAKKIESLFKTRCAEYKEQYKLNIGVYYTPAENLCYTAMKKFKEKYGVIEKVSDRDYFTNSIHVPVWEEVDPYQKIDIEAQLTGYSNAGCITYIEIDSSVRDNEEAVEQLIDYAMEKDIPYFAINIPNDTCEECGYTDEINEACPVCGSKNISRLRRVTGYLTGDYTTAFNPGKQREVEDRFKHSTIMKGWKHTR